MSEEEEKIDINVVAKNIKSSQTQEKDLENKIAKFCDELKIDKPFT